MAPMDSYAACSQALTGGNDHWDVLQRCASRRAFKTSSEAAQLAITYAYHLILESITEPEVFLAAIASRHLIDEQRVF
ncbi:hypothetical protein ABBQ32_004547 [Trebouxia sp. C0010 RCD-2024]